MSETELVASMLDAVTMQPLTVAFRNNTGRRGRVTFGLGKGSPDIVCIVAGRFVGIEAKTLKGQLGPDQVLWRDRVQKAGGAYFCCRSVLEAVQAVRFVRGTKPR